jgi:hypothetical protein
VRTAVNQLVSFQSRRQRDRILSKICPALQDALSLRRAVLGRFEKHSAAFASRSATPVQHTPSLETPGPGQYDSQCTVPLPQRAAVSPFVSAVRPSNPLNTPGNWGAMVSVVMHLCSFYESHWNCLFWCHLHHYQTFQWNCRL